MFKTKRAIELYLSIQKNKVIEVTLDDITALNGLDETPYAIKKHEIITIYCRPYTHSNLPPKFYLTLDIVEANNILNSAKDEYRFVKMSCFNRIIRTVNENIETIRASYFKHLVTIRKKYSL
tara:strand:+ start:3990 stop:4355 length:366 start_codon:yes stop_codon:yes gene_type:complete